MLNPTACMVATLMLVSGAALAGQDDIILEVTGNITEGTVRLDREALQKLPRASLETSTVVTDGTHRFTGFLMRDLLGKLGAEGDEVIASALNDYIVEIPMTDFTEFDVIVAYSMDGQPLHRNDKGPLWIVYPRDQHQALQDIRYDYRWVWQLSRLEVQ